MDVFGVRGDHPGGRSLSRQVFFQIREGILQGRYAPGAAIREGRLSQELGVSRTPVREAIRQLELEGLVSVVPNKGAVVTGVSPKDIEDIFAIRSLLEGLAAQWAAQRIMPTHFQKMEENVDLMDFYAFRHNLEKLVDLDTQFHDLIYEASGSSPLHHVLTSFHYLVQRARRASLATPGRAELVVQEHRAILRSFSEGDADEAGRCIAQHVQNAAANVTKAEPHNETGP